MLDKNKDHIKSKLVAYQGARDANPTVSRTEDEAKKEANKILIVRNSIENFRTSLII